MLNERLWLAGSVEGLIQRADDAASRLGSVQQGRERGREERRADALRESAVLYPHAGRLAEACQHA
jgi:hypothetical protein